MATRGLQRPSRSAPDLPRTSQDALKTASDGPKAGSRRPQTAQRRFKTAPRWAQDRPRGPQDGPRRPPDAPLDPLNDPGLPQMARDPSGDPRGPPKILISGRFGHQFVASCRTNGPIDFGGWGAGIQAPRGVVRRRCWYLYVILPMESALRIPTHIEFALIFRPRRGNTNGRTEALLG